MIAKCIYRLAAWVILSHKRYSLGGSARDNFILGHRRKEAAVNGDMPIMVSSRHSIGSISLPNLVIEIREISFDPRGKHRRCMKWGILHIASNRIRSTLDILVILRQR